LVGQSRKRQNWFSSAPSLGAWTSPINLGEAAPIDVGEIYGLLWRGQDFRAQPELGRSAAEIEPGTRAAGSRPTNRPSLLPRQALGFDRPILGHLRLMCGLAASST
jgi:hypothetical protein